MATPLEFSSFRERSNRPSDPRDGDLLVWHIYEKSDGKYDHLYKVENPRHARRLIDELANEQVNDENIAYNAFGLIVWEHDEWCEWCNDDGDDIDETVFDDINFRCFHCNCISDNSEKVMVPNWDKKHFSCKSCLRDEGIPEEEWVK
jgi:hypothetical protein